MTTSPSISKAPKGRVERFLDSDLFYSFYTSPVTVVATIVTMIICILAAFPTFFAPYNPFDLTQVDLLDAFLPPVWSERGVIAHPLGTDEQGRDILSLIIYGTRISLIVGAASVVFAALLGVTLGLLSGYVGGKTDSVIMRIAEIQLSIPALLIALLVDGVFRGILPREAHDNLAMYVLIFAIGISTWVQFARTVRGSTMVAKSKEYVQAAKIIGRSTPFIMFKHVLPNVLGPVLVIATINLALAIILEATLSYLGVGLPPTEPSLGRLIHNGNNYVLGEEWWISVFPGIMLVLLALSVNLLGDWLRDALNPRLR